MIPFPAGGEEIWMSVTRVGVFGATEAVAEFTFSAQRGRACRSGREQRHKVILSPYGDSGEF